MTLASVVIYDDEDVAQAAMVFEGYDNRIALMDLLREVKPSMYFVCFNGQYCEEDIMSTIADYAPEFWVATADNEQDLVEQWGNACTEESTLNMLSKALDNHLEEALIDEA